MTSIITLPPIDAAPQRIRGRLHECAPQALKDERIAWALARARAGYTAREISEALGVSPKTACTLLRGGGNNWFDQPRSIRHPRWRDDL